jgi:hypothetical protein
MLRAAVSCKLLVVSTLRRVFVAHHKAPVSAMAETGYLPGKLTTGVFWDGL